MGVSRERIIMMTFLIGGLLAGAAALLYTLKVSQGIIYSGGFLLGIKAFSAAVLGCGKCSSQPRTGCRGDHEVGVAVSLIGKRAKGNGLVLAEHG